MAKAVLAVLFYVYNSRISNGNREKVAFYSPLPLQKSSTDDRLKKAWTLLKMKRIPEQIKIILLKFAKVLRNYITPLCQAGEIAPKEASGSKIYQSFHHF